MKKMMMILALLFAMVGSSFGTGMLVEKGTVTAVLNNHNDNDEAFILYVDGGGHTFHRSDFSNQENFNRAYATALTAFNSGCYVSIYHYPGKTGPTYILLEKN